MDTFVSYSRRDEATVKTLARGLEAAHRSVWLDSELSGGDAWWDKILAEIRGCSVFVFALSNASLASKPCLAELEYAVALGREIIPIQVGPATRIHSSPLSAVHIVPYRPDDASSGFEVLNAVAAAEKRRTPLPDQLPDEPPIPFAYLQALGRQIDNEVLNPADQTAVVEQLRKGLREESEDSIRKEILGMLDRLLAQQWVTKGAEKEIEAILYSQRVGDSETPAGPPAEPPTGTNEVPTPGRSDPDEASVLEQEGRRRFEKRMAEVAARAERRDREERDHAGQNEPASPWKPLSGGAEPTMPWKPGGGAAGREAPLWGGVTGPTSTTTATPPTTPPVTTPATAPVPEPRTEVLPPRSFTGPPQQPPHTRPSPPNFWALSIVSFLIGSLLFGGIAMYFSYQVGQLYQARDYDGAERASRLAKGWGITGLVVAAAAVLIYAIAVGASG